MGIIDLGATPDEMTIGEGKAIGRRLFGDQLNMFRQGGLWHVGRFLDSGKYEDGPNKGRDVPPYHRRQEIFGVNASMRQAFRFAIGTSRAYSGAGGIRGLSSEKRGYRPVMDDRLRIVGWESSAGIFSKAFPSDTIVTA